MKSPSSLISAYVTFTPDMRKYFRSKLRGVPLTIFSEPLNNETLDNNTTILVVFVDSQVTKKTIDALPRLELIVTLSTGFDHIDTAYAKKKKIPVCNVPSYGENTVAEYAIALILTLSRNIFGAVKRVKEGVFDYHGLRGMDIKGKTIGIIGTGRIGLHTIRMLKGFDASIIAYDAFPKKELQQEYGFSYVSLNTLLKESDIISLHAPLCDDTYHMIDKKAVKKMKPGVVVVNTARGGLIDSEALLWGLNENIIGSAGLDVLEEEDLMEDHCKFLSGCSTEEARTSLINNVLIDHPRTVVTPHNAFNSTEAVKRIIDTGVENIKSFFDKNIRNSVQ